jgi:Spy/CpxP family protein refolding chaperone
MSTRSLKVIVMLVIVGVICGNCWAADANTPAATHKKEVKIKEKEKVIKDRQQLRLDEMTKNLNLTKEQRDQIKSIFANEDQQIDAILQNSTLSKDQQKTQMEQIHKSTHQQVKKVLTPEQREKQKKLSEERKEHKEHQAGQDSNSVKH